MDIKKEQVPDEKGNASSQLHYTSSSTILQFMSRMRYVVLYSQVEGKVALLSSRLSALQQLQRSAPRTAQHSAKAALKGISDGPATRASPKPDDP